MILIRICFNGMNFSFSFESQHIKFIAIIENFEEKLTYINKCYTYSCNSCNPHRFAHLLLCCNSCREADALSGLSLCGFFCWLFLGDWNTISMRFLNNSKETSDFNLDSILKV